MNKKRLNKNEPIWVIFGTQNFQEIWSKQLCFCPRHLYSHCILKTQKCHFLNNKSSSVFSAVSGQVLVARNWIYFWYRKVFTDLVYMPNAMKLHNMHIAQYPYLSANGHVLY